MYGTVRVGQCPTRTQYRTSGCCTGYTVVQRACILIGQFAAVKIFDGHVKISRCESHVIKTRAAKY